MASGEGGEPTTRELAAQIASLEGKLQLATEAMMAGLSQLTAAVAAIETQQ